MTLLLSEQSNKDLILIQPYYSQKQQKRLLEISVNCMMKLRKQAGLEPKEKGRPKGTGMVFKGEEIKTPKEITEALDRIKLEIKIVKILTVFEQEQRPELLNKLKSKLQNNENKYDIIKELKGDKSRIEEFINK